MRVAVDPGRVVGNTYRGRSPRCRVDDRTGSFATSPASLTIVGKLCGVSGTASLGKSSASGFGGAILGFGFLERVLGLSVRIEVNTNPPPTRETPPVAIISARRVGSAGQLWRGTEVCNA
jgi:hypothetical protein